MADRTDSRTEADRAAFDLWTACPMTFHEGRGQFRTFPRFSECRKPAYTQAMAAELIRLSRLDAQAAGTSDRWVYVVLDGKRRQVLRSHLLTQVEYDKAREKDHSALVEMAKLRR